MKLTIPRRPQIQKVPVRRRLPRLHMRLDPSPRRVRNKSLPRQNLPPRVFASSSVVPRIDRKKLLRPRPKVLLRLRSKTSTPHRQLRKQSNRHALHPRSIQPATAHGPASRGKDIRHRVRQKIHIHIRPKPRRRRSRLCRRSLHQILSAETFRSSASFARPKRRLRKLPPLLLGHLASRIPKPAAMKRPAALPNRLRDRILRQRRSHQQTHRKRPGRLAKDRNILGIPSKRQQYSSSPTPAQPPDPSAHSYPKHDAETPP